MTEYKNLEKDWALHPSLHWPDMTIDEEWEVLAVLMRLQGLKPWDNAAYVEMIRLFELEGINLPHSKGTHEGAVASMRKRIARTVELYDN